MSDLVFLSRRPDNAETPLRLLDGRALEDPDVYVRQNFDPPAPSHRPIRVSLGEREFELGLADIGGHEQVELRMVLECAGNGRSLMRPATDGVQWGLGAASPVVFGGCRLLDALAPVPDEAAELVFTGRDRAGGPNGSPYRFSLTPEEWHGAILAVRLGDHPLSHRHGGPVRLVLPGHYAMKSVKWLESIHTTVGAFDGEFVLRYRYFGDRRFPDGERVGEIQVRSLIATPTDGALLEEGQVVVTGSAWSGGSGISAVEVSVDGGLTWRSAEFDPVVPGTAPVSWRAEVDLSPGANTIAVRATDGRGVSQVAARQWNENGFANNLIHEIEVTVGRPASGD